LTQPFEQHWAFEVQALPEPLQAPPLIGWHVPVPAVPHLPLQHCVLLVQVTPSLVQALAWQVPFAPQ
jgi:hypothetical protein